MAYLTACDYQIGLLSFDYGQRHVRELDVVKMLHDDEHLNCPLTIVDLRNVGHLLKGSALTDPAVPVPHGAYAQENMKSTVVPNRNAIFLSIAFGIAASNGYDVIAIATHAGDHRLYKDCRSKFLSAFAIMELESLDAHVTLLCPFVSDAKADIVRLGNMLCVPMHLTWSCYEGRDKHCGKCGTCIERRQAFKDAGVTDYTEYEEDV
jgi:7-cyano-7-deazaguanine synthase